MSPVFVNTVRASFYRFRPDLGGLRVGREIVSWRTKLRQCGGLLSYTGLATGGELDAKTVLNPFSWAFS